MPTTTERTAAETFQSHAADIHNLLDHIDTELTRYEEYAETEGIHWGHAGDMTHYRNKLIELLQSLMGSQDSDASRRLIEDALADARA